MIYLKKNNNKTWIREVTQNGLKGSQTEKNLLTAFAGESQARNRYTYFASKLGIGIKQLLAGVRKFKLHLIGREDIASISQRAIDVCNHWNLGIAAQEELDLEAVKNEIYSGNY